MLRYAGRPTQKIILKKRWSRKTGTNVTRGQRPNESQKAVIIDMIKSVGEIASKIWQVIYYLTHFGEILTLTFGIDLWSRS